MKKNTIRKVCLFLLVAVTTGIRPALAQDAAQGIKTLDLGQASDDELIQALNKAGDIELVNTEDTTAAPAVSADAAAPGAALPGEKPVAGQGAAVPGAEQPAAGGDNDYLRESRRLAKRAEDAFSEGDYDASARFADEAAYMAMQSDVNVAITEAKRRLDRAVASGASARFSKEYGEAENRYKQSVNARDNEEWDAAINNARIASQLLENLGGAPPPASSGTVASGNTLSDTLPAIYTVRPWSVSKDCFWNIAGFPWVYGDPHQWRVLYNANKSKLPNPNNPNILEPGTVLDIPSIKGEMRQGAWESGRTYKPFK